jgi:3-oxoacyl-[acyl-carrier protein] reductase
MSDMLVDLSTKPWFRQAVKSLGLPLPTPQKLRRPKSPWVERPLQDRAVIVGAAKGGALDATLADMLPKAGADPHLVGVDAVNKAWLAAGEAYGRPPVLHPAGDAPEGVRAHALVLDATGVRDADDLRGLYDFFHPWLPRLGSNGRVLVLGRPPADQKNADVAGAQAALDGFVRSLAKEIGRKGATAHVVYVSEGAEAHLAPIARFLLSERSAFLTGQPWHVSAKVAAAGGRPVRPLEGRTVLVTGAARGIGAATAHRLAAEGAHVVCLDRPGDEGPLSKVVHAIEGSMLTVDITDADAPAAIATALLDDFEGVDGVIHNAGITRDKTLARMKPEWWDQAVAVNLGAVMKINARLLEEGAVADGGRIVCLSSVAGIAGNVGQTNYAASKAGLVGYVRALAAQVADRDVTVNAVAPGFIETRLTAAMPAVNREVARRLSALGQGGLPADVAELLTFLVTPHAAGLTGQVFRACGGMFIGA